MCVCVCFVVFFFALVEVQAVDLFKVYLEGIAAVIRSVVGFRHLTEKVSAIYILLSASRGQLLRLHTWLLFCWLYHTLSVHVLLEDT